MNEKSRTGSLTNLIKLYFLHYYVMASFLNSLIEELINVPRLRNADGYENVSTSARKYIHYDVRMHSNADSNI